MASDRALKLLGLINQMEAQKSLDQYRQWQMGRAQTEYDALVDKQQKDQSAQRYRMENDPYILGIAAQKDAPLQERLADLSNFTAQYPAPPEVVDKYAQLIQNTQPKYGYQNVVSGDRELMYPTLDNKISGPAVGAGSRWSPNKPTTNIYNTPMGLDKLADEMGKGLVAERPDVENSVAAYAQLQEAKSLLDSGAITGAFADWKVGVGKALQQAGISIAEDPIANTEAYAALMGRQVGQIIKQFGAGTGLSDADREYAEKIVAGKITMNEKSMRKIIEMNERAYKNIITRYNERAEQVMGKAGAANLPYDLRVNFDPDSFKPPKNSLESLSDEDLLKGF